MKLFLDFAPEQTTVQRLRLTYAFRLFCAIYGHDPILDIEHAAHAAVWLRYSRNPQCTGSTKVLHLSNLYQPREPRKPAPPPKPFSGAGEKTCLFYGTRPDADPDWLGEIFEWVSCADEYSVTERDIIGRVPFKASYVGRHSLKPDLPYAAIAMRLLQTALCEVLHGSSLDPVAPLPFARHYVVNTHDIDFLPVSRFSSLRHLVRAALISILSYRSLSRGIGQVKQALLTVLNAPISDLVSEIADNEVANHINSSFYFLVSRKHQKDGNYRVDDRTVLELMRSLERKGMEIGLQGSYTSLEQLNGLPAELAYLRSLGFFPKGSRQHWLRFTVDRLISAVQQSGEFYDVSLGWSECMGFRAGACFAFPPYDFEHERPAAFLEFPLIIMEETLRARRCPNEDWYYQMERLLSISRRYGWGGVSVVWHPDTFLEDRDVFRRLIDAGTQSGDTWLSSWTFFQSIRHRYVEVGLLPALDESGPANLTNGPFLSTPVTL